jgi:hypothetical protein
MYIDRYVYTDLNVYVYVYIYVFTYIYIYLYIYIYIYILRRTKVPKGINDKDVTAGRIMCDTYKAAKEFLRETSYRCIYVYIYTCMYLHVC